MRVTAIEMNVSGMRSIFSVNFQWILKNVHDIFPSVLTKFTGLKSKFKLGLQVVHLALSLQLVISNKEHVLRYHLGVALDYSKIKYLLRESDLRGGNLGNPPITLLKTQTDLFQDMDNSFSKKEREDTLRTHKDSLQQQQKDQENQLDKTHREAQSYEVRKFRRQKLMQYHGLEQELLLEVGKILTEMLVVMKKTTFPGNYGNYLSGSFFIYFFNILLFYILTVKSQANKSV